MDAAQKAAVIAKIKAARQEKAAAAKKQQMIGAAVIICVVLGTGAYFLFRKKTH